MTDKENAIYEFEKMATWSADYTDEELQAINYARKILHSDSLIIPTGATNGDIIKAMFPDAEIVYHEKDELVDAHVTVHLNGCDTYQDYSMEWWNAPYKSGVEEWKKNG